MRIRIVTFGLNVPAEAYTAHAEHVAPGFTTWPGLLGKWWLADTASGTFGGVYLFASQHAADRSRETDLFRGMFTNPALKDVTVREHDVLDAPTAITAPALQPASTLQSAVQEERRAPGPSWGRSPSATTCGRSSATCRSRSPWSPASAPPGTRSG